MNITNELGLKPLVACCPSCVSESLYCGKIDSKMRDLKYVEMLYCKKCKFAMLVEEFKNNLYSQ